MTRSPSPFALHGKLFALFLTLISNACGIEQGLEKVSSANENIRQIQDAKAKQQALSLPLAAATGLSFNDKAAKGNVLSGVVQIGRATDESSLTHYVLYWGMDEQTILPQTQALAKIPKESPDISLKMQWAIPKPSGATHFLVRTGNKNGEMKEGVSSLIRDKGVPEHSSVGLSFVDMNINAGKLGGDILLSKALDESDVTHYVLYWGKDEAAKLNSEPITTIEKTGENLIFTLPENTVLPQGAVYLLAFAKNNDGEAAIAVGAKIIDLGVPVNAPVSVAFVDVDPIAGKLNGRISVTRAANERDVSEYVIYWGSDKSTKLDAKCLAKIAKRDGELFVDIPSGTIKPENATQLLVFSKNDGGEMAEGVSATIIDKGVPEHAAVSVSFSDTNPAGGLLSGIVEITRSLNESDVKAYVIYWGTSAARKLNSPAIAALEKTAEKLAHEFPADGTMKPPDATHILVFTKNDDGEMATGINQLIVDRGVPVNSAVSLSFADTNLAAGKLSGNAVITKASDEWDVTHYVLYWGSNASTKLNSTPIATLAKTGANLTQALAAGTVKPTGATHVLVFTKNEDGEMATGVSQLIVDKGVPVNAAVLVSFADTDLAAGKLAGTLSITRAANESDIMQYLLYWGSNASTKLNSTPIATLAKTGANLSQTLAAGTVKPTGATHFLVYTKNADGEMATGVSQLIVDKGVPVNAAVSVAFTDTQIGIGKLSGVIAITKASNESDIMQYVLYWGSNASTKLNSTPIAILAKTGANLSQTLAAGTVKPTGATHFLVYTKNADGEMATGVNLLINDK